MNFTKRMSMMSVFLLFLGIFTPLVTDCEAVTWRMGTTQSASAWAYGAFKGFSEAVKQNTGGRLVINVYAMGELGIKPEDYLNVVRSGGLELAAGSSSYFAESMPVLMLGDLPGFNSGKADNVIEDKKKIIDIIKPKMAEELKTKYRVRHLLSVPWPMCWLETKKEIPNLLDLRGLKVRAPAITMQKQIINLGGNAVFMPGSEVYPSLEKAVINGVVTSMDYVLDFKFYEQLNYIYMVPMGHGFIPIFANNDAFEALPKDVQDILLKEIEKLEPSFIDWAKNIDSKGIAFVQQRGVKVIQPTRAQLAEWREKAVKPIWKERYTAFQPEIKELFKKCAEAMGIVYP